MTQLAVLNGSKQSALAQRQAVLPGMTIRSLEDCLQIGALAAKSGFFSGIKNESAAVVKIIRGWELGIAPIASLENIHVIEGKTSLSAPLIAALIKRSKIYNYRIARSDHQLCTIKFFEQGEELGEVTWTIQDAERAKLASKKNWQNYPRAMLRWRALTEGARAYCSEIFGGAIYAPEELGMQTDASGVAVTPPATIEAEIETQQSARPTPKPIKQTEVEPSDYDPIQNAEQFRQLCEVLDIDPGERGKNFAHWWFVACDRAGITGQSDDLKQREFRKVCASLLIEWAIERAVFPGDKEAVEQAAWSALSKLRERNPDASGIDLARLWKGQIEAMAAVERPA